jgi:hypothetical protein
VQDGAFPCAVPSEHDDELARMDPEADAVHDMRFAVGDVQIAHCEKR